MSAVRGANCISRLRTAHIFVLLFAPINCKVYICKSIYICVCVNVCGCVCVLLSGRLVSFYVLYVWSILLHTRHRTPHLWYVRMRLGRCRMRACKCRHKFFFSFFLGDTNQKRKTPTDRPTQQQRSVCDHDPRSIEEEEEIEKKKQPTSAGELKMFKVVSGESETNMGYSLAEISELLILPEVLNRKLVNNLHCISRLYEHRRILHTMNSWTGLCLIFF